MISFSNEDTRFQLKQKRQLKNWIGQTVSQHNNQVGDIAFVFCSDEHLLSINKQYLNHDTYTDIITFDYTNDHPKNAISGDIFISIDRVKENAEKFGKTLENELQRVIIHGVLHLLGYKDKTKTDKTKMTTAEDVCLMELTKLTK